MRGSLFWNIIRYMNIISILYFLLIRPLELIYEFIFSVSYQNSGNAFFSIVILSISVGLLSLPLYNRADKLQQESTVIEKHMKPGKDRIKKPSKATSRSCSFRLITKRSTIIR